MNAFKIILITHQVAVSIFLLIYLIKTSLLLLNKSGELAKFTKIVKVPEMIISVLFLGTGIYMLTQIPEIKTLMILKIVVVLSAIPIAIVGFKKSSKPLATLAFLLLFVAYGLAEMSKKQVASPGASTSNDGSQIYSSNCAKCHGADGKLALMGASDLSVSSLDMNTRKEVILHGRGAMAGFSGVLSEEQTGEVARYIETLRK